MKCNLKLLANYNINNVMVFPFKLLVKSLKTWIRAQHELLYDLQ